LNCGEFVITQIAVFGLQTPIRAVYGGDATSTGSTSADPADRLDVLNVAVSELRLPVPSTVCPALNVTVPVAADGLTAAVNVTD
jgi:hypothetical protein